MKPVVVNPRVSFEQLAKETVEAKEEERRRAAIDEFLAKVQRKKRALTGEAEERLRAASGMGAKELGPYLKKSGVGEAAEYLKAHPSLASFLDRTVGNVPYRTLVATKPDELREVTHGYGKHGSGRPGDYLEAFRAFVETNMNTLPALLVVTQRPRDLTREDLVPPVTASEPTGAQSTCACSPMRRSVHRYTSPRGTVLTSAPWRRKIAMPRYGYPSPSALRPFCAPLALAGLVGDLAPAESVEPGLHRLTAGKPRAREGSRQAVAGDVVDPPRRHLRAHELCGAPARIGVPEERLVLLAARRGGVVAGLVDVVVGRPDGVARAVARRGRIVVAVAAQVVVVAGVAPARRGMMQARASARKTRREGAVKTQGVVQDPRERAVRGRGQPGSGSRRAERAPGYTLRASRRTVSAPR